MLNIVKFVILSIIYLDISLVVANDEIEELNIKIEKNKYVRGAAYRKLLFFYGLNKNLYFSLTTLAAYLFGIREMMIVATKK